MLHNISLHLIYFINSSLHLWHLICLLLPSFFSPLVTTFVLYISVTAACLTLWPRGLQHTRLLCPPLSLEVCSDSCLLSWWCYLTTSSSAIPSPFASSLSSIKVFSNESALHRWPKYLSFSFSISPSNKYSGLISIRIDWFVLLAVQGTLQSLLQHHNLKASILQCSAFFMVHLSHLYMTTGKTIALTI